MKAGGVAQFGLVRRLGAGVWRCDDRVRGKVSAVKFIEHGADAKAEVRMLRRFWHPNVICEIDFVKWRDLFGIVMPLMDMDLRRFMCAELYDVDVVCGISLQCARGLAHVHEMETIHADIKPENIGITILSVVSDRNTGDTGAPTEKSSVLGKRRGGGRSFSFSSFSVHVRLLDFGSAQRLVDIQPGITVVRSTARYLSPEKRLGVFHLPGDIYALGVVFREVVDHSDEVASSEGRMGNLVSDMLQAEPRLRPTAPELLVRLDFGPGLGAAAG